MKRMATSALSAAAFFGFLAGLPARAQDTVTGAPPNQAPVTVEGYHGYGSPAYRPAYGSRYGYGPVHGRMAHVWRCHAFRTVDGRRVCRP